MERALIQPGYYKHKKGGTYTVLMVIDDWTNARPGSQIVVYVSHKTGKVGGRDLEEFTEFVEWDGTQLLNSAPVTGRHPRFMRWP